MQILFEDNHLIVVNKPADWIVQGAGPGQRNLLVWVAEYIKRKHGKPGNVFIGVVSRLDAPVTGVLPLARTSKAASRLSEQFREHTPKKTYWAIVQGRPKMDYGRVEDFLIRRPEETTTTVGIESDSASKSSILEYRVIGTNSLGCMLEIELITGRKHQIRCQLENLGCPILGDNKYGSGRKFAKGIALHCRSVTLQHPTLKQEITFTADLPDYWQWF